MTLNQMDNYEENIDNLDSDIENSESIEFSEDEKEERSNKYKNIKSDETKAKKKEIILSDLIIKILKNPKYDEITNLITDTLKQEIPSNILVWVLSIVYIEASNQIRDLHNSLITWDNSKYEESKLDYISFDFNNSNNIVNTEYYFDEKNIPKEIEKRLKSWITDIYCSSIEDASSVFLEKCLNNLDKSSEKRKVISNFIIEIFIFFLKTCNIKVKSKSDIEHYSEYIIWEILSKIK